VTVTVTVRHRSLLKNKGDDQQIENAKRAVYKEGQSHTVVWTEIHWRKTHGPLGMARDTEGQKA
jgi:hypothetical protein